jgi:hypothetical protein
MGSVEGPVVESFWNGGGVPYSAFHCFHEVMAEDSGQTVVAALTDRPRAACPYISASLLAFRQSSRQRQHIPLARTRGWSDYWVSIKDLRSQREAQGDTPASGVGAGTLPPSERAARDAVSYRKRPRAGRASDVRKPSTEYGIASLSRFKE